MEKTTKIKMAEMIMIQAHMYISQLANMEDATNEEHKTLTELANDLALLIIKN